MGQSCRLEKKHYLIIIHTQTLRLNLFFNDLRDDSDFFDSLISGCHNSVGCLQIFLSPISLYDSPHPISAVYELLD